MSPYVDPRAVGDRWQQQLERERQASVTAARMEYIKPLIMLVLGWIFWVAYNLATEHAGLAAVIPLTVGWAIMMAISIVAGLLGLIVTCKLFGDDAGLLTLAFVRLAGIYSVIMLVAVLCGHFAGCFGLLITLGIMAGLIAWLFEWELRQGLIVAVVTWCAWLATFLTITWLMN